MGRKRIVPLMTLVAFFTGAGSTALAAPNGEHASCEAILTWPDAQIQFRDNTAVEFTTRGFPPGEIVSAAARAPGTTEEECQASSPG
jgi:hypothetical protein